MSEFIEDQLGRSCWCSRVWYWSR